MKRNLREEISKGMESFSRTQQRLANFLIDNWAEIPLLSIETIAQKSNVSMASITRLTRKLACKGFHDFKNQVRGEHIRRIVNPVERFLALQADLSGKKPLIQAARQDVKNINHLLSAVSEETFQKLVEWVEGATRVYTFGVGISAIFSNLIAYTFSQIQKETHSLDEGHMPVEEKILGIGRDELVIFSSFFPYSKSTVEFARLAHRRGLRIVVLHRQRVRAAGAVRLADPEDPARKHPVHHVHFRPLGAVERHRHRDRPQEKRGPRPRAQGTGAPAAGVLQLSPLRRG